MELKLLSGALGAEIKGIDLKDTSDKNFKKINDLLIFYDCNDCYAYNAQPSPTGVNYSYWNKFHCM